MVLELHEALAQLVPVFGRDDPFAVEPFKNMMFDAYEDLRREQSVDPSPRMRRQLRRFVFALFYLRINLLLELLAGINSKG